ncbi:MAG TPA: carboxypeptidase-like regulatory domain-containing protein [Pyrinomonadaceae bacterium]|jgi:hypothetical protein|nr:carboxypeptidase-like regulatory domain-containing protein [Pyrinomonadaceae bacterium]
MSTKGRGAVVSVLLLVVLALGCKFSGGLNSNLPGQPANVNTANANTLNANANAANPNTNASSAGSDADGVIPSGTGVEKEKPSAGKGNVQGRVLYNSQPAVGVEVKLCEKFSQFFGGCGGQTYSARTDSAGEYLIKDVPPKVYEGLIAKVFDTGYYVFATSGIVQSAKYKIEEGKTFFAPDANLFKSDLKLLSPKAGSKIGADNIEVKWAAYPDAAYYKFSIYADTSTDAKPEYDFINKRVDDLSYVLDKPLTPGSYTCKVSAYNGNDVKLAESADDIKFTVTGGAAK